MSDHPVAGLGAVLVMTVLVYAPTIGSGFVYEDLNDPAAFFRTWTLRELVATPLRSLTHVLQWACLAIGGSAAWPYHALSVGLHLVNVLMLGLLAGPFAAGVFALHPIQTETVAYVSSQADLLATTCVLAGLWCASKGHWFSAATSAVAAILAKETAIVGVGLIPLAAWRFDWPRPTRAHLVAGALAGMTVFGFVLDKTCWGCTGSAWPIQLDGSRSLEQLAVLSRFVGWTFLPVGIAMYHEWTWVTPLAVVGSGFFWSLAIWVRATRFAAAWVLVALVPRVLVAYGDGMHDHHWYLPMAGLCLALGAWWETTHD